jgi:hypothetical protein
MSERMPSIDFSLLTEELRECKKENRELQARNKVLNIQLEHTREQIRNEYEARVSQLEQEARVSQLENKKENRKENSNGESELDRTVMVKAESKKQKTII